VTITVTRDFGTRTVVARSYGSVPSTTTVLSLTRRAFPVALSDGRLPIRAIQGVSASPHEAWFLYVNGSEMPLGPATRSLYAGEKIWWDLHPASASTHSVVGSFPEPFVHGIGGKRLPTTLECASDVGPACRQVSSALEAIGVPVAVQTPGTGSGTDSLAVAVGTWADLRGEIVTELLQKGPSASGVYARFAASGRSLELLDAHGVTVRRVLSGGGLIAAIAQGSNPPTWLVTGTDPAGVRSAADALTAARLRGRFALAVSAGADVPLPVPSR
jgi:hypothetical protein